MIKQWKLARFKSVVQEITLELAPLTIFTGANSSGKSTILQSILMTAQSLQSAVQTRPVVLNGHMTRLGAFDDIVSDTATHKSVVVGFTIEAGAESTVQLTSRVPRPGGLIYFRTGEQKSIECSYRFSASGPNEQRDLLQLQPRLEATTLRVTTPSRESGAFEEIRILLNKTAQATRGMGAASDRTGVDVNELSGFSRYKIRKLTGQLPQEESYSGTERVGVTLLHFLPSVVALSYDAVETEARRFVDTLGILPRNNPRYSETRAKYFAAPAIQQILREIIEVSLEEMASIRPQPREDLIREMIQTEWAADTWSRIYLTLPLSTRAALQRNLGERSDDIRNAVRDMQPPRRDVTFVSLPESLEESVYSLSHYFGHLLKYLGPLRDDPKPIYPLAGSADPTDVGLRGEYTAAVLDIHRQTQVTYIPSICFANSAPEPVEEQTTLLSAVLDWLSYMGVGQDISTLDRGKLGHELKVATTSGTTLHDLTQVGVGVSQVLPILVLSLLAEPHSTLIFEQPELHLHPRVQTRLADFFVAMTQLGKQCVVESHSEYLINRLRYRAAMSRGSQISDSVILYFVEKEENQSKYRPIRINEYGVIEDWPKGFFDENEEVATQILRAGMQKRKSKGAMS